MPIPNLERRLGLLSLSATGICSMLGASIYIVPFMIQRNVEGIGDMVIPAFMLAAIPAILAAISYASLSTAMPVAGGSYIYASRGLHPFLGFIASFSQWFGLSIAIGVIAYVIVPFLRDVTMALQWTELAAVLDQGTVRVALAILILWIFVFINIRGLASYKSTLIPLMVFMFLLGILVIIIGFSNDHQGFISELGIEPAVAGDVAFDLMTILSASAVLFASFIGFDSIAQAGSEAKNPTKNLPLAILVTILSVAIFYFLFTSAVYHAVPWQYVKAQSMNGDVTAPGLLSPLLTPYFAALIIMGAAVALINDLPAMLLSVSRLMFAWANDGIFPASVATVHPKFHTPFIALIASGMVATLGILGSHFAGDFFLGVDIMVTSMLVNFMLMCLTLTLIYRRNPVVASKITLLQWKPLRLMTGIGGILVLSIFLIIHITKDLNSHTVWYLKSTPVWSLVMFTGSMVYLRAIKKLKLNGVNINEMFATVPDDQSTINTNE